MPYIYIYDVRLDLHGSPMTYVDTDCSMGLFTDSLKYLGRPIWDATRFEIDKRLIYKGSVS